jgi:hypothetical protein
MYVSLHLRCLYFWDELYVYQWLTGIIKQNRQGSVLYVVSYFLDDYLIFRNDHLDTKEMFCICYNTNVILWDC